MAANPQSVASSTPPAGPGNSQSTGNSKLSDLKVSIAATVIALASLGLSVWQGRQTMEHSRLSLKPHLKVTLDFASNPGIREVYLRNAGPGPAIIKSFTVVVTDKTGRQIKGTDADIWAKAEQFLTPGKYDRAQWWLDPDDVVAVDEVQPLVRYSSYNPSSTNVDLDEFRKHVTVRICYCSVYEDCSYVDSEGKRLDRCPG